MNTRLLAFFGKYCILSILVAPMFLWAQRSDRIALNGQDLFISGGNVAWVNFAQDVGINSSPISQFDALFSEMSANKGNTMRLWIHTNGAHTPSWDGFNVTGAGEETISDLKAILDTAWAHKVSLILCLWSFDMLRKSYGPIVTDRARSLLTDSTRTRTYINNALIPMVKALKGHPAILAWEILNEPEGMSNEFGWDLAYHVPMSNIQRFVNMTTGAIHRADPQAKVTNGSYSMSVLTDVSSDVLNKTSALTDSEAEYLQQALSVRYRHTFSLEETRQFHEMMTSASRKNYYSDAELIKAGNDAKGTLDFYTAHYYDWGGTALSPFHHDYSYWKLTKPLVIAEFFLKDTFGVSYKTLYETLYNRGYAGALGWQWYDRNSSDLGYNWTRILENTRRMWTLHSKEVSIGQATDYAPPFDFSVSANYPNPFDSYTTFHYKLPQATSIRIQVFDVTGRLVLTLIEGMQDMGEYTVTFESGNLPNGFYLLRFTSNQYQATRKMILLR
jgi:hypothetical protein